MIRVTLLTKLKVTRCFLTVPSQAAAVQKRFAAAATLLRAAAFVPHVKNKVRLLGVTSPALRAGKRSDLLRLMAGGSGIPVTGALLVTS